MKIPAKQRQRIKDRAGGLCEKCRGPGDWRGLSINHNPPTRMGGTKHVYTDDQLEVLCYPCHSAFHGIKEV